MPLDTELEWAADWSAISVKKFKYSCTSLVTARIGADSAAV